MSNCKHMVRGILAILITTLVVGGGFVVSPKIEASSTEEFVAEYGGYGLKGDWETLGTASADLIFDGKNCSGSIILGANQYMVTVTEQYAIDTEEGKSIVYEGNLTEGGGSVRFAHYSDVLVGEIEVNNVIYSFGVAETLDSARNTLDQYNDHLQEEITPPEPYQFDAVLPSDEEVIPAFLEIDPDTLNLKSKGEWITVYIELSHLPWFPDADVTKIDINSVRLDIYPEQNNKVPAENNQKYGFVKDPKSYITDHDHDGELERMVKFDRAQVQNILYPSNGVPIVVTGSLNDGRPFFGIKWIKVIGEKAQVFTTISAETTLEESYTPAECPQCSEGGIQTAGGPEDIPEADGNSLYRRYIFSLPGGYVAAGVGMRNVGDGIIKISGIPAGSTIEKALLYWNVLDNYERPELKTGRFNGTWIQGTRIGYGASPCWSPVYNIAYRADVTNMVTGNGYYYLTNFASGDKTGCDPWSCSQVAPLMEGASLVVIWENVGAPQQTIVIYDGAQTLAATSYTFAITGFTAPTPVGSASITYIGADGQDSLLDAAECTYFNGVRIADRDWEGSDPREGDSYSRGNLWDTNTYDVTSLVQPGATSATARVISYGGNQNIADCLVWVAAVFSVSSAELPQRDISVRAAADEEYVARFDQARDPYDQDQYKSEMKKAVAQGNKAFLEEFKINFVVNNTVTWDSDDNTTDLRILFNEARLEVDKGSNDVLVIFTGQIDYLKAYFSGSPIGLAFRPEASIMVIHRSSLFMDNLMQHEFSHIFGAPDHGDDASKYCIMSYSYVDITNHWCGECHSTIMTNRLRGF